MVIYKFVTVSRLILRCKPSSQILKSNFQQFNTYRFVAMKPTKPPNVLKKEKEKLQTYIVQRYIDYVKNYTKVLEVRFPTAMKMYRVFSVGIKDFLKDLKTYITLRIKISKDRGFSKVSRQEIELYKRMPGDMCRIAPVLILSAIPFGNYIIFPLAFLKPKKLLCSHFWSIQQRVEFSMEDLKERLKNNKPVFRALQAKLHTIPSGELKEKWSRVIALLGSGTHPTTKEVIQCKELFTTEPYQLNCLTYSHLGHLLKMHGYPKNIMRRKKLKYIAFLLLEMDKAIMREGGVKALNAESLRNACLIRGLYGSHLTNQQLRNWLDQWLEISQKVDKDSYSLILHCPIFLTYNHPQNWVLIY